jgi:hypothetical protein
MNRKNQLGYMSPLLVPLIVAVITTLVFAALTIVYLGKYKTASTNLQGQINSAVTDAKQQQQNDDKKTFAEQEKLPLRSYQAPANINGIKISFPKTWSDYVNLTQANGSTPLDFYANPDFVPAQTSDVRYALRVQLTNQAYNQIVQQYNSQVQQGKATAKPITLNGVQGIRIDGTLMSQIQGAMVVLPIRDKTLLLWTESQDFVNDFNKIILPNLSFNP